MTLRDLATQNNYTVSYDPKTKNVSILNPTTGKNISFESGKGQEYGFGGLSNGSNIVQDSNKLIQALSNNQNTSSQNTDFLNNFGLQSNNDIKTQRQTELDNIYKNLQDSQLQNALLARQQAELGLNQQKYDSESNYNNLLAQLNQEKQTATPQYQELKNQQFAKTLDDIKKINEDRANLGQYYGGANAQVQSDQRVANENNMNQINLQEQQLYNDINNRATEAYNTKMNDINKINEQINLLKSQGSKEDSAIISNLAAQKAQAQAELTNILDNREMQLIQLQQQFNQDEISNAYNMANLTGKYISPEQQQIIDSGVSIDDKERIDNIVSKLDGGYAEYMKQLDPNSIEYTKAQILRNIKIANNPEFQKKYQYEKFGTQTMEGKANDLQQTALKQDIEAQTIQNKYLAKQLQADLTSQQLQNIGLGISNKINQLNLDYLPEKNKLEIKAIKQDLEKGNLENAYQKIVNANLPDRLDAELNGMYADIEGTYSNIAKNNIETSILRNQSQEQEFKYTNTDVTTRVKDIKNQYGGILDKLSTKNQQTVLNELAEEYLSNPVDGNYEYLKKVAINLGIPSENFVKTIKKNSSNQVTTKAVDIASNYIGTPYVWGGNSLSKGVDCSGLTQQAFKSVGINLPRTASQQSEKGKLVSDDKKTFLKNLKTGDLVFFDTVSNNKKVDHVGIYIGNGQMLHASSGKKQVTTTNLSDKYWVSKFVVAKRIG